ncbi:AraC family transcriptional regulator [Sorangium sp. So ce269]
MRRQATVSVLLLRQLVEAAAERGLDARALLIGAGLDLALLDDPDARAPAEAAMRLWEELPRKLGDDSFGLHLAERESRGSLDVVEYVLRNSPDLGTAYQKTALYMALLQNDTSLQIRIDADHVHLATSPAIFPAMRHAVEYEIAGLLCYGRRITGVDWAPRWIAFEHEEPTDIAEHCRLFRSEVRFRQPATEMVFDRALLSLPVKGADPALYALLVRHADEHLSRQPAAMLSFTEQARAQIGERLARRALLDASSVARSLGLSKRSFERRLRDEGTRYWELLDTVRRDLALSYLRESQMQLDEVTFLLGFAEASAFYRAFRRWTGTTPFSYRRRYTAMAGGI